MSQVSFSHVTKRFGAITAKLEPNARRIVREGFLRGLRARTLTCRELVEVHIARTKEVNPKLNALVVDRFAQACMEANQHLGKLVLQPGPINADLEAHWVIVAEAIQTVLRREAYPNPYEALKELTTGPHEPLIQEQARQFLRETPDQRLRHATGQPLV